MLSGAGVPNSYPTLDENLRHPKMFPGFGTIPYTLSWLGRACHVLCRHSSAYQGWGGVEAELLAEPPWVGELTR